ncbi:polysaccharide biosynthesis tyrosine autokinase [Geodermatophilus obscurus]|uniref:non-specific protein-tyrosine kinase n=1 Tax=Geodermatophilus obscurus (strain ATCC 25078 / DSM 43160 / JCM 3152 / CCUG 61914 / KCC A-0152 / KCTC 9177 / NBRC 13315 / NRRL B-3577 / G-20) TaxID=526225 RepID=D2S542_GEOOG|nr:polysaccharide biosynthesis tyrosine autokinase [Geodermatophilus obscurus]ADB73153.1 capsular exopolysaccharide family [Geodermatophilus obscurus DSM 43160]
MDLQGVLAALRSGWWLLVIGMLFGGAAGLGGSLLQTPVYVSSTQFFVSTTGSASTSEAYQGSQFSQERVTSYVRLLTGDELAGRVVDRLNLDMGPEELVQRMSATAASNTVLIDVSISDPSPEQAQRVATVLGQEFPQLVSELETPDGGGSSPVKVTVTERPEAPATPVAPRPRRNAALGVAIGLLVGIGLAVTRVRLDRTVKALDEAASLVGAPVIGTVVRDAHLEKRHIADRRGNRRTAEDYRQLRTNLQFLNVDAPPRVIMVSSALPSEGKTTVVVNLALALADVGQRVTLVDADLRRPQVTSYLGLVGGVGLTNVLAGTADIDDVKQTYGEGLSVVAAGPTPPNPGELLASSNMARLVEKLRGTGDFVIMDAPPLLPVADAIGLAPALDGVLLSVRFGCTRRDQLQQAAAALSRVGATTLGVILNMLPPQDELAAAYGYGYGYERSAAGNPGTREGAVPQRFFRRVRSSRRRHGQPRRLSATGQDS